MGALTVLNVVTYGINHYTDSNLKSKTIHAEYDAIAKLPNLSHKKHLKKINLAVIKTSKTGHLGNSKPCFRCLLTMKDFAPIMGYRINWIYYSDEKGLMQKTKLNELFKSNTFHVSSYYKNSHFKHPLLAN